MLPELKSGGVETGVVDITKELVKKGHKSVVISAGGVLVREIKVSGGIHYALPVDKKNPIVVFGLVKKIRGIIKNEKIDVVHARSRAPAFSSFFAAYLERVTFITTCHGYYSKHILSCVMGWGKLVIVASQVIAKHMIEDFRTPRKRIRLIPRGVDMDKFKYKPMNSTKQKSEYTIAMVGRITPMKGHKYFIRAIAKAVREIANIKVLIIGEASSNKKKYEAELMTLVNRLSLSKCVDFLGRRDDVPKILQRTDLLVLPSTGPEAFGRVIIEAQATGVPTIATKVGGIVDIIKHEKTGLLVPAFDTNLLSQAIVRILKDRKFALKLSTQARADVEKNFNLEKMYKKTIQVYEEAKNTLNILVIKISAIGDVILSIPSLAAIRRHFPKSKIAMLVGSESREVVSNCPYVDEIIVFKQSHKKRIRNTFKMAKELRRENFDIVIDLQNNRASHLLGFLSMIPRRIGYKSKKFDFFLTDRINGAKLQIPPLEHQFKLLKVLGIEQKPRALELFPTDADQAHVHAMLRNQWLSEKQILIGMNIGSSTQWETKRWGMENFIKLNIKFSRKDIRVVITGSKADMPQAHELVSSAKSKPIDMVGKTSLMELACLIKKCKLFITGDSAPLHIANAVSTPCVAMFGPTDPKRHLQPSKSVSVMQKKLSCSPCYKKVCKDIKCMNRISAEEIFTIATRMLDIN